MSNEERAQLKVCKNALLRDCQTGDYYQEIKSEIERLEKALKEAG